MVHRTKTKSFRSVHFSVNLPSICRAKRFAAPRLINRYSFVYFSTKSDTGISEHFYAPKKMKIAHFGRFCALDFYKKLIYFLTCQQE